MSEAELIHNAFIDARKSAQAFRELTIKKTGSPPTALDWAYFDRDVIEVLHLQNDPEYLRTETDRQKERGA